MFLMVTPAHNEADNVAGLVDCVRQSSLRPDRWIVVDDRSTDDTAALFETVDDLPITVVPSGTTGGYMGFRYSEVVRAGIAAAGDLSELSLFGILDCDIRFGPTYWADLNKALRGDKRLGIVSGALCSPDEDGRMRMEPGQRIDLPRGGLRLTKGDCFRDVDGFERSRAPDSVMTVRARGAGYTTRLMEDHVAWSVRPTDSRGEDESGWESRGRRMWNVGQPRWQVGLRAGWVAIQGQRKAARGLVRGYRDERESGEQLQDDVVQRYYRRERPKEWLRSLTRQVTGRDDPYRFVRTRVMSQDEVAGMTTRPTPS
jgi:hypothetical protein